VRQLLKQQCALHSCLMLTCDENAVPYTCKAFTAIVWCTYYLRLYYFQPTHSNDWQSITQELSKRLVTTCIQYVNLLSVAPKCYSSTPQSIWPLNSSSESNNECHSCCSDVCRPMTTYTWHWVHAPQVDYWPLEHLSRWMTVASLLRALLPLPLLRDYVVTKHSNVHTREDTCQRCTVNCFHVFSSVPNSNY